MKAVDASRILVKKYIEMNNPATNLKIQKLLYFAWIEYYRKNKRYLFEENFLAWKFGPVVWEAYNEYRIFGAVPITFTDEPNEPVSLEDRSFLEDFASRYKDRTARQLVYKTHEDGTPWKKHYKEGETRNIIPFEEIIRSECCEFPQ